jgi:hypothetical protein
VLNDRNEKESEPIRDQVDQNDDPAPPCCGSGCAVCVLDCGDDYWGPQSGLGLAGLELSELATAKADRTMTGAEPAPECCGTGCTVCVLDYSEVWPDIGGEKSAAELEKLVEAFENADWQLQMISESRTI